VSHASRRAGKPQPVFLPPYSPELNPIERLWLHLRDNRLSHCDFQTTGEIVDTYCDAWNWLSGQSHWLAQEAALEFGHFRIKYFASAVRPDLILLGVLAGRCWFRAYLVISLPFPE
jgi:transposase